MFSLPGLLSNNDSGNTCLPSSQHALEDLTPFALDLDCSKPNLLGHGRHAEVYRAILHPSSSPMRQYLLARKGKPTMLCKDLLQSDASSDDSNNVSFACAAKCLFSDADSQSQGLAEAKILRRLHTEQSMHPGRQYLVDCYGIYDKTTQQAISCVDSTAPNLDTLSEPHDREWVLLLEYCQNGTIWDWIRQHPERVGHRQWLDWAIQLLQAVSCIHEAGLIHHDIKPHNILLDSMLDAKLSDFGAGVFLRGASSVGGTVDNARSQLTLEEGRGRGTLPYAAPEMFASSSVSGAAYGQAIDIYSLGVSLYVIGLTAQEPFHKLKSVMEMMVWIKKGGFWLWEDQGWVHDRGHVPKATLGNNRQNQGHNHGQSQEQLIWNHRQAASRTSKPSSISSGTSTPNLPPINTQLSFDHGILSPSSASSVHSPTLLPLDAGHQSSLAEYSPEKSARCPMPTTPVSPLPFPSPVLRSQTPRSAMRREKEEQPRKSGEIIMRFLDGEVVPQEVVQLLKEMCHPVPGQRPSANAVLERLLAMREELDADMDRDMDVDEVDMAMDTTMA
ncbi:hypothetical protein BGX34_011818 [Mortierella sp. NVP85]|nr:hypothetical protein BGX34_011818 [Mortierella sp. NVP85]